MLYEVITGNPPGGAGDRSTSGISVSEVNRGAVSGLYSPDGDIKTVDKPKASVS